MKLNLPICRLIFIILAFSSTSSAAPNLMLFPTRVVFDKNKRAFQVDLTNTGSDPGTYRITLENKRMTETGKFVPVDKPLPDELSADKIIQYSPRQVELAPGAGQTIRLVLRKPADLPTGEYRSHLVFTRLPDASAKSVDETSTKKNELGISITPLIGASIPIIVEHGDTTATVNLKELKYLKAKPNEPAMLELRIERTGNRSVYGDLSAKYIPKEGSEEELADIKGIAVYSPYPSRIAKIALQTKNQKPLTTGKIIVKYSEARDAGGRLLSEASIDIP